MKTTPSRYILAAELATIFLFHAVKIKQAEKRPAESDFTRVNKTTPLSKPVVENKSGIEYLLVKLVK